VWSTPRERKRSESSEGDFQKQAESQTPLGRIPQPEDIAPIAVFLASADSRWLTGETLLASGGLR
jgi:3-oxoacyl-[acyl-carrier protein] reductase